MSAKSFLLRLPASTRDAAFALAKEEGVSLNFFITLAVSEKVSRMQGRMAGQVMLPYLPAGAKQRS